jgi:hypothetical protein
MSLSPGGDDAFLRPRSGPSCVPSLPGLPASRPRTSRSAINSWSSSGPWADHAYHAGTESSGSGCPGLWAGWQTTLVIVQAVEV